MGTCWNCGTEVILKEEEVRCDRCKKIVRYWCWSCKKPFDVQEKENLKRVTQCKWCPFFKCPFCGICGPECQKHKHLNFIQKHLSEFIAIDKWEKAKEKFQIILDYFEEIKMGRKKTTCAFGVPKSYAKEKIKNILAKMEGFRVRSIPDRKAFEAKQEEILDEEEGYEFTIGNTREDGTYGQEYRDAFNLGICLGKLEYQRKSFKNNKGIDIGYDSWTRTEGDGCPYLDTKELIVKMCPKCKKVFSRNINYCDRCIYVKGGKTHSKGEPFKLIEKLSDNPTCKNLGGFKTKEDGESKYIEDD